MATTQKPRTTPRSRAAPPKKAPQAASEPDTHSKLRMPLLAAGTAAAGILGGVALGAKALPHKRSRFPAVNGIELKKLDMKKTAKVVGRASKQFGELTKELRKAGEQAERIGDALS